MLLLVGVVGLAKLLPPTLERLVTEANAPQAVVGVLIALVVLAPKHGLPSARHAPNGCKPA